MRRVSNIPRLASVVIATAICAAPGSVAANTPTDAVSADSTTWQRIRSRMRLGSFSELSGPALQGEASSVPTPQGGQLDPVNFFTALTFQYDLAKDLRFVWTQGVPMNLVTNSSNQGFNVGFSDPQLGVSLLNLSSLKGLTSSLDLFVNAGVSSGSLAKRRWGEPGIRLSLSYQHPGQQWTVGAVAQARAALFRGAALQDASDVVTSTNLWASYAITSKVSTQHSVSGALNSGRGDSGFVWGSPGEPVAQNGIGFQVTQQVWLAALLNNYLFTAPSFRNSWTSLWLSVNVL